jgi:flagellar biosynthetic protein FliS
MQGSAQVSLRTADSSVTEVVKGVFSMRAYSKFAESYGSVQVTTGVATADNIQLIQMLFDGLLESLASASGHIQNNVIEDKSKALARAGRIVVGLQGALDFERAANWHKTSTSCMPTSPAGFSTSTPTTIWRHWKKSGS